MSTDGQLLRDLGVCLQGAPPVPADWLSIIKIANDHLLTPALWSTMRSMATAVAPPADACAYMAMLHRLNGDRNSVLKKQAMELIAALNRHGIVPIVLKGGLALFDGVYTDPAMRMMRDLDVLVPIGKREEAIAILEQLGYLLVERYGSEHHAYGEFARPNDPGPIDLHIEMVDPSHILPASEVWSRAKPREVHGIRFLVPSATDQVMHNILHAQIHHLGAFYRGVLPVQQVYELFALARHFGHAVDWRFVEQRMRAHRLTTALQSYLLIGQYLYGMEWPLLELATVGARLHSFRCKLQIRSRSLNLTGIPWGNLRGAFAWHRMRALHGSGGGSLRWRVRHALQYVRRRGIVAALQRLVRVH